MRVHDYISSKITNAYLNQSRAAERKNGSDPISESKKPKTDEIVLSSHATEVRKFEELAETISEVRQEKIATLKHQIDLGVYDVEGQLVAKGIADILS